MGFCDRGNAIKKSLTGIENRQRAHSLILPGKFESQFWLKKEMIWDFG